MIQHRYPAIYARKPYQKQVYKNGLLNESIVAPTSFHYHNLVSFALKIFKSNCITIMRTTQKKERHC